MRLPQANINQLRLNQLFSDREHYTLPQFQRGYSWGLNEINILIDDIAKAFDEKSDFIIGTTQMVTFDRKLFYIIDGQQRLSTLYFLLKTFYELYPNETQFLHKHLYVIDSRTNEIISDRLDREQDDKTFSSLSILNERSIFNLEEAFKQIAINLVKFYGKDKVLGSNGLIDFILDKIIFINTTFISTDFVTDDDKIRVFIDILQYFVNINTKGKPFDKSETLTVINFLNTTKINKDK